MKMKTSATAILLGSLLLATLPAHADENDSRFAVSGGVGTMGGAIELKLLANDYLTVRGGGNIFTYDTDVDVDDINYNAELDFSGAGVFADLHPFKNSFVLSGGAFFGEKVIDIETSPDRNVEIGGAIFTPAEYGSLVGQTTFNDTSAYIGLGFDNTFLTEGAWGFSATAGAAMLGSGDVYLESQGGSLSNDPTFRQFLDQEALKIEDEIDGYEIWPVVQVGLSYKF